MSDLDLYDDLDEKNEDSYNDDSTLDQRTDKSRSRSSSNNYPSRQSSCAVYIGNLTWWTTDQNLIEALKELGVNDVEEIKFFENKGNGQSKGFCVVTLGSENSRLIVLDKLPKKEIHGQNPVVTVCTKQNLNYFESQSKKEGHGGANRYDKFKDKRNKDYDYDVRDKNRSANYNKSRQWNDRSENYSRQHHHAHQGSNMPPQQSFQPTSVTNSQPGYAPWPPSSQVQMPPQMYSGPPPLNTGVPLAPPGVPIPPNMRLPPPKGALPPMGPRNIPPPDIRGPPPPPGVPQGAPHLVGHHDKPPPFVPTSGQGLPSIPPPSIPGSHVNPPFYHQQSISSGLPPVSRAPEMYNPAQYSRTVTERSDQYRSSADQSNEMSSANEAEFEEIMSRNRSVSSNAISRAISDAAAGEFANAVETLVTAISLIKQSKIGNDERCKILINSLQDTLHGIESKLYRSRSKDRSSSRERERSRERPSRREKSSRRDRSRSRDREYRDRSRERDRYHEDRYRDKDRDHRSSRR